jgi:uncharacterized membrane protein
MILLLAGLILFLGIHSVHFAARGWRDERIAQFGYQRWKGIYSLVSIVGFVLIIVGFGIARKTSTPLWIPPASMRHATELLTLIAFVLIAATYVPNNPVKATVHHPMVLGTACWALGHLLANGSGADVLLFGAFLVWGIVSFVAGRRRDRIENTAYAAGTASGAVMTVIVGVITWIVFAFWLHGPLIGVRPFA